MYRGPAITLEQVLENRELRAERQRDWVSTHSLPIVSFTINMPGSVKLNQISQIGFKAGQEQIRNACMLSGCSSFMSQTFISDCGCESMSAVGGISPQELKRLMVEVEDTHPLGRLFDIDVFDTQGVVLSRDQLGFARRRCFVCGRDAKLCARNRVHPLPALIDKLSEIIHAYH